METLTGNVNVTPGILSSRHSRNIPQSLLGTHLGFLEIYQILTCICALSTEVKDLGKEIILKNKGNFFSI